VKLNQNIFFLEFFFKKKEYLYEIFLFKKMLVITNYFCFGKFLPLDNKYKSSGIHTKDFCEEKVPKSPDFKEKLSEIAIFTQ
jgi:hypothetical protein